MKLNHDCVRELLLEIEAFQEFDEEQEYRILSIEMLPTSLTPNKFSKNEVIYSTLKLKEAGFINASYLEADGGIYDVCYSGLTYAGHDYLDSIRSKEVWSKVKTSIVKNGGSLAFAVIQQLAIKVLLG